MALDSDATAQKRRELAEAGASASKQAVGMSIEDILNSFMTRSLSPA